MRSSSDDAFPARRFPPLVTEQLNSLRTDQHGLRDKIQGLVGDHHGICHQMQCLAEQQTNTASSANSLMGKLESALIAIASQQNSMGEQDQISASELQRAKAELSPTKEQIASESSMIERDIRITRHHVQSEAAESLTRDEILNRRTGDIRQRTLLKDDRRYWEEYPTTSDWWGPGYGGSYQNEPTVARDSSFLALG